MQTSSALVVPKNNTACKCKRKRSWLVSDNACSATLSSKKDINSRMLHTTIKMISFAHQCCARSENHTKVCTSFCVWQTFMTPLLDSVAFLVAERP